MKNKEVIWVFGFILCMAFASAIPQTFNVHGKLTAASDGSALEGTYTINFTIYDAYTGGSNLWSGEYSVTTNSLGVYSVILSGIDLNFSEQFYLGVNVESDGEMSPRLNLTSSPYAFRAQNISSSGIEFSSDTDMGIYNLTTSGYVTAGYFVGDGSQLTGVGTGNGDADYEFGANNFNGSGNFTTTGVGRFGQDSSFYAENANFPLVVTGKSSEDAGVASGNLIQFPSIGYLYSSLEDYPSTNYVLRYVGYADSIFAVESLKATDLISYDSNANFTIHNLGSSGFNVTIGDDGDSNNLLTVHGDLNVTGSLIGAGGGDASYEFGANNFNGSGNFVTSGWLTTGSTLNFGSIGGVPASDTFILTTSGTGGYGEGYEFRSNDAFSTLYIGGIAGYGNSYLGDNDKIFFGAGNDSSIYYNTTDLVINPRDVGTGSVAVLGDLEVTGTISGTGVGSADYEFGANNFNGSGNFTTTGVATLGSASQPASLAGLTVSGWADTFDPAGRLIQFPTIDNAYFTGAWDPSVGYYLQLSGAALDVGNASIDAIDNYDLGSMATFDVKNSGGKGINVSIGDSGETNLLNVYGNVSVTGDLDVDTINSTSGNVTISSVGGSVIVRLG